MSNPIRMASVEYYSALWNGCRIQNPSARPRAISARVGFLKGDGFRIAVAGEACGDVVGGVEEPSIACFGESAGLLVGDRGNGAEQAGV